MTAPIRLSPPRIRVGVGDDPELISAVALDGRLDGHPDRAGPTILVAGPAPEAIRGAVVLAIREGRSSTVLSLPDLLLPRAIDLVPLADGAAMALVPGHGLLRLDPDAPEGRPQARRLVPHRVLPDRIVRWGDGIAALRQGPDGRVGWTRLRPDGVSEGRARAAGPRLGPGQSIAAFLQDAEGRPMLLACDEAAGLAGWAQSADGDWTPAAERGAGRFGFNATALDACLWEGRVAVAAGPTEAVRDRLSGLPVSGEILLLGSGRPVLLMGELRTAPGGLMVPQVGADGMAALGPGVPRRLLSLAGLLVASIERPDGSTALRGITAALEVIDLGHDDGTAIPVALGSETLALLIPEG